MNVMIDVETAGNCALAAPIAIGVVEFDANRITYEKLWKINLQDSLDAGMKVTASTINWWMGQPELWRELQDNTKSLAFVLSRLALSFNKDSIVWARGVDFDFGMVLRPAYELLGMPLPWDFRNQRCMRTLELQYEKAEKAHDPLQDALAQTRAVMAWMNNQPEKQND